MGVATNKDEYVPTITPTIKANIKPLIESPPKKKMANNTIKVVIEVFKVLPIVLFKAVFTIFSKGHPLCVFANSRILSKITTVSFNE